MRTLFLMVIALGALASPASADPLPDTKPLTLEGDPAAKMVEGIHKYLDRELEASVTKRRQLWKPDFSSAKAYERSVEPNRERLRRILGIMDKRLPVTALEYVSTTDRKALVAEGKTYSIHAVRWRVLDGVDADGLLLEPKGKPVACVVAVPDADWTPEMLVGLAPGVPKESQLARRLAENGCRVLVPTLIDRKDTWSGNPKIRMTNQPHREFIYRMAYQNGRHIIGYEVQKVLAAVDWFTREKEHPPVGVFGYGEGGLLALYSGALDPRIQVTVVSGYFGPREDLWREPIYRNVWGLSREFGPLQVAMLIAPRTLIVECSPGPYVAGPPSAQKDRSGAAPGSLPKTEVRGLLDEVAARLYKEGEGFYSRMAKLANLNEDRLLASTHGELPGDPSTLSKFLKILAQVPALKPSETALEDRRKDFDPGPRQKRQFDQLVDYSQKLMRQSEARRPDFFWSKLDTSSPETYQKPTQPLRDYYWEEVIGKLPKPEMAINPRSRLVYDQPKWKGYEVMLELYPDVFAYGILLVPKDLKPGEKRPVVVCQHGLEGTPKDVVDPKVKSVYNSFGAQLADRGFIVYAPQNPYKGGNNFRQINRKANPLKLTMFSFIVRQHERTLDWLATVPFVDPERIAFYGLSYGGETAVRVPPLVTRYVLSICSADFNHFPWKTCTLDFGASYMLVNTYEIFDFNMNNTFSHAEMAALIAPRPFMVERGHDDGVGLDEWVSYEYAKVRRLYAKLKLSDRTAIEFFDGGHEIHGKGTFAFLEKHLKWPKR
jgi:dienelactone hydrolase